MAGIGTLFVELDLDPTRYMKGQQTLLKEAQNGAAILEKNFKNLGIKSDATYDLMRAQAEKSFQAISKSHKATSDDIARAEKAKSDKITQINEQQFGKQTSLLESLKSNWMAVSAAVIAAWYAVSKVVGAVEGVVMAAARYETLGIVMETVGRNAGFSKDEMEQFAQGLEKTGISMTGARESLTKMAQAQLDLAQSTNLARIAQDAAVIGNINSTEAFNQLVYGIQSANVRVLRTIGINVDFESSYKKLELQIGKTKEEMTEAEKAQARLNVVLEAGTRISGSYEAAMETAGKQVLSLERHFDNLKVLVGAVFTPALAEMIGIITGAVVDLNEELSGDGKRAIEQWGINFRLAIISIEAEFMRLAMLLDKIGGTMTSAQMLLYGPGAALGFESSKKRFESAAEANIQYEKRYLETEKRLQALANRANALEVSLTTRDKGQAAYYGDLAAMGGPISQAPPPSFTSAVDQKAADAWKKMWEKAALDSLSEFDKLEQKSETTWAKMTESGSKYAYENQKMIDDLAESSIKNWDQLEKREAKGTADRLNAYRSMYDDLQGYAWDSYNVQVELIKKQSDEYIRLTGDEVAAAKWRDQQIRKTWIASAQKSEDFFAGVRAGFMSLQDSVLTWGQVGYNVVVGFSQASHDALKILFLDAAKGELKDFEDYWQSFTNAMLNIFVDMLAQMAVNWVQSHIFMSNASSSIMGSSAVGYGGPGGGGVSGMLNMGSMAGLFGGGAASAGPGAASWGMEAALGMAGEGGVAGATSFMSALGPMLLASGIGYVGGGMLFGEEGQMGATFGAGLGAFLGSIIPGVGTVIGAVSGGFLGGLIDKIFHEGGMLPYAHSGLFLKQDEQIFVGQSGEGILSRRGMTAIGGESGLNAINRGSSGGSNRPMNIIVQIGNKEFGAYVAAVSDNVRVKAERRGMGQKRIYN